MKKSVIAASVLSTAIMGSAIVLMRKPNVHKIYTIIEADGTVRNCPIFESTWTLEQIAAHQKTTVDRIIETPEGSQLGRKYDKASKTFKDKLTPSGITTLGLTRHEYEYLKLGLMESSK